MIVHLMFMLLIFTHTHTMHTFVITICCNVVLHTLLEVLHSNPANNNNNNHAYTETTVQKKIVQYKSIQQNLKQNKAKQKN